MDSIEIHSTEALVDELLKRSVCGYVALWAYDVKSGETYNVEELKGDPRLLRGIFEDACDSAFGLAFESEEEEDEEDE